MRSIPATVRERRRPTTRIGELEQESRKLCRANEILKAAASAFPAQELDRVLTEDGCKIAPSTHPLLEQVPAAVAADDPRRQDDRDPVDAVGGQLLGLRARTLW
jgi:hypothetical protein